ncbi:hypothetical protein [Treponema putidum]|uniref:Uncharacterized protein n=1 Tax=Treponema putidum TaxID=221027 RepID=A0ABY5HTZ1_9SPIR|nr:hypothetical protein [Treponema putidum]UTY28278.1 hypothetical protein E4N76_04275 [Treponema putidum]
MTLYEYYIIYPDGEKQEISGPVSIGAFLDINGNELPRRLPTNKMIVYQIQGKQTREERGIVQTVYILEQLNAEELLDYV